MSELTRCNHCNLRDIRARAQRDGQTVTLGEEDGWISVHVDGKRVVMMKALTESCAC